MTSDDALSRRMTEHALRGAALDLSCQLEEHVDHIVHAYFGVPDDQWVSFSALVLDAINYSRKIEILRHIVQQLNEDAYVAIVSQLAGYNQLRNLLAHSPGYHLLNAVSDVPVDGLHLFKSKKGVIEVRHISHNDLARKCDEMEALKPELGRLYERVAGKLPEST